MLKTAEKKRGHIAAEIREHEEGEAGELQPKLKFYPRKLKLDPGRFYSGDRRAITPTGSQLTA